MVLRISLEEKQVMISVEKALKTILANFRPLGVEKVNILEAQGRVIAENIFATRDIPPADNSAMDGYALRSADIKEATKRNPIILKIIEDIPAGKIPRKKLKKGEAARIMTGAVLPQGADAVVRQEDAEKNGQTVSIFTAAPIGCDIRFAAEDVREGELVIPAGTIIRPAQTGMLASLGHSLIGVYQRPRVAIIATGNELTAIKNNPPPGKIINSNSYSLAAAVMACGGIPLMMGIAKDKKAELERKFKKALHADLIISSGGVSVGDFDFVKDVMGEIGNSLHFWQVAMRPGKPLAFGTIEGTPLFGLPGNPVSVMVSFEQFVRPCLLKMQGHAKLFRRKITALSAQDIRKKEGIRHFIRVIVRREKDKFIAATTGDQGSGIMKSMVLANALIVLNEKETHINKGDTVNIQLLDDSLFLAEKY
jgi:molybdopterin molybdotransferase